MEIVNRKAHHDYFVKSTYEAGIELMGTEIKSIRLGNVNINDSYARIKDNEVFLIDSLEPGNGIGIWIQRTISNFAEKENEEMIDDYNSKREFEKLEEVELVVNYNILEQDDNKI